MMDGLNPGQGCALIVLLIALAVVAFGAGLWVSVSLIGWEHTKYAIVAWIVLMMAGSWRS